MDEKLDNRTTEQNATENEGRVSVLFHDMLRGARKYWWALLACVAVFAALGLLVGLRTYTPMYKASATFTVETHDNNSGYSFYYDNHTANQMALTFPYLLDSDLLLDRVKADLQVEYLNGVPTAESVENSNLFTLSVTSSDPEDAYDILLAVMDNYPDVARYVIGHSKLNIIDLPQVPTHPYNSSRRAVFAALGGSVAIILDCLLLVLYALSRNTIRREEEIQQELNTTCLGCIPQVIPKRRRKNVTMDLSVTNNKTGEDFIEGVRRVALYTAQQMSDKKILLVTATTAGEGVTVTARNLALTYAQEGKKTLLIDGHLAEDNANGTGLERYLLGDAPFESVIKKQADLPLYTAACDKAIGRRDWPRQQMAAFMDAARQQMDVVVIDAPACQRLEQIAPLMELTDAVIYVVRQDKVKAHRILACFEDLHPYDVSLLGCVFNGVEGGIGGYGYHYGYGYGYSYRYGYGYGRRHGYGRYGYGYGYGHRSKDEQET